MGIYGLAAFVKEHSTLGEQKVWTVDASEPTTTDHFIVDGNAFTYHYAMQFRNDWIHGGQYSVVADAIRNDVLALQRAGIQLTVLFDGAVPQDKQRTRLKRYATYLERASFTLAHLEHINSTLRQSKAGDGCDLPIPSDFFLLPPLMLDVCVQTFRAMGVETIVCAAEADGLVARMAALRNGYMVSKDSDMHVFPRAGKGYIPLGTLMIRNDGTVSATAYNPESLAALLDLRAELLPLFGTLLGNDYLDSKLVRDPIIDWCVSHGSHGKNKTVHWPKFVAEFLRKTVGRRRELNSDAIKIVVDELNGVAKKDCIARNVIDESIRRYDPESALLDGGTDYDDSSSMEHASRAITDIVQTRTFWAPIFLEDLQQPSSWLVSRRLRQHVYAALLSGDGAQPVAVREYIREKQHLAETMVEPASKSTCMRLTADDGFTRLAQLHHTEPATLAELDREWWPLVLCIRCLIYELAHATDTRIKNHEVIGLLVGGLIPLSARQQDGNVPLIKPPTIKRRGLHLTAQLQSVIFCSHLLGQALGVRHLEQPEVLTHMYNGVYMHHFLLMARRGASIGRMLGDSASNKRLFWNLYRAVMVNMERHVEAVFDYAIPPTWAGETPVKGADWLKPSSVKKRSSNSAPYAVSAAGKKSSAKRKATAVKSPASHGGGANIFDVLTVGCSFEDDDE